ncbi:MAG: hypothetical protein ACTH1V_05975 [Alkalibacterium gilvum]
MTRKIYTGKKTTSSGPYSHAVDASDYLFFSGQTAHNATTYSGETLILPRKLRCALII